jgi:hypothetical protein
MQAFHVLKSSVTQSNEEATNKLIPEPREVAHD